MIWFECKKCGRRHSRAESSVGTMVFCDCGQGITVPWESTVEPPPPGEAPAPLPIPAVPLPGRYDPVPVGEERIPPRERPAPPPDRSDRPIRPRRRGPRRRDPRFCLDHEDTAAVKTCADCGDAFCADCVLEFRGATLCGPCKNFRVQTLQRPPRISGKALSSLLVAILCWPFAFVVPVIGINAEAPLLVLLALAPQVTALVLGLLALRDTEVNPRVSGRSLAITGVLGGSTACVLALFLTLFPPPPVW
jgi:hypothetical protein